MANRSSFPDSIDVFNELSEILASDKTNVERYQTLLMKSPRTSEEETELSNLKVTLKNKIVSSEDFNKLSDCIVNLETFFKNDVEDYLSTLDISVLRSDLGVPTDLNTANKTNVVSAINETNTKVTNHTSNTSDPHQSYAQAVAWAKSYGLGDVAKEITGADLNNLDASGFYRGANMINRYSFVGGSPWQYVIHVKHDLNYHYQLALDFETGQLATRTQRNGTWQSWRLQWDGYNLPYSSLVMAKGDISSDSDINWMFDDGVYSIFDGGSLHSSFPSGVYRYGTLIVASSNSTKTQMYFSHSTGSMWQRTSWGNNTGINWTPWKQMVSQGDTLRTDRIQGYANGYSIVYFGDENGAPVRMDNTGSSWRLGRDSNNYVRQDSDNSFVMVMGGVNRHIFYSNGTKSGGSIIIDGHNYGMSPIDSPKVLIEDLIMDITLTQNGVKVYLDDKLSKAIDTYAIFPNNPTAIIIEKTPTYFVVKGEGIADFSIKGHRIGYKDVYWDDLESVSLMDTKEE